MYNRFLYQRSSDFGRRWPSPRTSLCPYKDSSSAPFYPMPPRGYISPTTSTLLLPKEPTPLSTNPHTSLFHKQASSNTKSSTAIPSPKQPPSSPTYYYLHTLHRAHTLHTSLPCTSLSYREYTPSTSDPRTSPADGLPRALRGTQYARGSVHACTLLCTHVYSNVYTRVYQSVHTYIVLA